MRILTLASAMAFIATGAFAQDTVRIGTEGAYPPFNFINDAGELDGFEIVLGTELCSRAGLTCEFVQNDWDSIIPNLTGGNYDVIMAGMSITDEREEVVDFTQNYKPPTPSAFMGTSADVDTATGTISAQTGTIQAAYVAESGATLLEFATPEEIVSAVRDGESDAAFDTIEHLKPIVDASGGELVFVGDLVPLGGGIGAAFRDSDDALREQFDAAIQSMKDDGSLNALITEWFGAEAGLFE